MQSTESQKMIYVTGASGQIGQTFRKVLSEAGYSVVVNSRVKVDLHPNEIFQQYKLGDAIIPLDGDYEHIIFHFAHDFFDQNESKKNINLIGLKNIVNGLQSSKRKKIIFISTPDVNNPRATVYTTQKKLAEEILDRNRDLILRPSLIYSEKSKNGISGLFSAFSKLFIPIPVNRSNIAPIHITEFSYKIFERVFNTRSTGVLLVKGKNTISLQNYLREYYQINALEIPNIFWLLTVKIFKLTKITRLFYLGERILGFIYLRDIGILTESDTIEVII